MEGIGASAFEGCGALSSIVIPNGVTAICRRAFIGCTGLIAVTLPTSIERIYDLAFGNCTSINNVHYYGPEQLKEGVYISPSNSSLLNAQWHYAT